MLVADVAERRGDAVEERFGADEAVIGQHVGAIGQMLAGAESDLEVERALRRRTEHVRVISPSAGTSICGSKLIDQILLALAKLMPG